MSVVSDANVRVSDPEKALLDIKPPRVSFNSGKPPDLPAKSPQPKVNFNRPQPGQPLNNPLTRTHSRPSIQHQMGVVLNRIGRAMPHLGHGTEPWMYAAGYVIFYTLLMLFRMSTFGFICIMLYTLLITLLALRYFGHGPLVDQFQTTSGRR